MKKNTFFKRAAALVLTAALVLSLGACGKKDGEAAASSEKTGTAAASSDNTTLAQELGYGYLSEFSDLGDMEISYVSSAQALDGTLYLQGEYYNETTYESGSRFYARDLASGETREIPLPELVADDTTNEYIQRISVAPDGNSYWAVIYRYTFDPNMMDEGVSIYDDVTEEVPEEALPGEAAPEAAAEETAEEALAEPPVEEVPEYAPAEVALGESLDDIPQEETPGGEEDLIEPDDYPAPGEEYGETYFLKQFDMEGNLLQEIDLSDATEGMDYFYIQSMAMGSDGTLYLASDSSILVYDSQGVRQPDVESKDFYVESMIVSGDGSVLISGWDMSSGASSIYRLEGSTLTPLETDADTNSGYQLFPGPGGSVLFSDRVCLYSLDTATGKTEKLLSWLDSDINSNNTSAVISVDEETILVLLQRYHQSSGVGYELGTLKKVPASEIPQRTILTLGAEYLGDNIQNALIDFNRHSDTYRITLVDYSQYNSEEDWEAGAKQMDRDIISGVAPDILSLNSGNVAKYINKGALLDLSAQMEKNDGIKQADLLAGPMKAFSQDGKLYGMPLSFSVNTVYASAKLVGDLDHWDLNTMKQVVDGLDPDVKVMNYSTQQDFLNMLIYQNIGHFVDYGAATCSFDSEDFQTALAIAAKLPAEMETEDYSEGEDMIAYEEPADDMTMLQQGDVLMVMGYGVYGSYDLPSFYRLYTRDHGIVNMGFPTAEGSGGLLQISSGLAISSRCANPDGAWAFIASMLTDEAQRDQWSLPVTRSAMDQVLKEAMEKRSYQDMDGETVYIDTTGYIGGTEYKIGELTQEQADEFLTYIDGCSVSTGYDSDIMDIISEESAAFFSGDKTADEVAKLIQNRVSIYLGETS